MVLPESNAEPMFPMSCWSYVGWKFRNPKFCVNHFWVQRPIRWSNRGSRMKCSFQFRVGPSVPKAVKENERKRSNDEFGSIQFNLNRCFG